MPDFYSQLVGCEPTLLYPIGESMYPNADLTGTARDL